MLKAYIVGLNEPTHLLHTLPQAGIAPVWIQGVNGKKMTDAEYASATSTLGRLTSTRISAAIGVSHLRAVQSVLDNRDEYALIADDDIVLESTFRQYLSSVIANTPSDFDILYLGCFGCTSQYSFMTLLWSMLGLIPMTHRQEYVNEWVDRPVMVMGAHSYIVSRTGAQKIVKLLNGNLWQHIDVCYQSEITSGKLNAYVSKPRLIMQTSTDPSIQQGGSTNTVANHPIALHYAASHIYPDKSYNMKYFLGFVLTDKPVNITVMFLLFLLAGLIIALNRIPLMYVSVIFGTIILPDIVVGPSWSELSSYYAALVLPTLLKHALRLL